MVPRKPKTSPSSHPARRDDATPDEKTKKPFLEKTTVIVGLATAVFGALIAGVTALILILTFLADNQLGPFTPSPDSLAATYDNTNPSEDCAPQPQDATTLNTIAIFMEDTDTLIATLEIRHSPDCDTTWARVTSELDNVDVQMLVKREAGEGLSEGSVEDAPTRVTITDEVSRIVRSNQLYAPNCNLVSVGVTITDQAGTELGTYPLQPVCQAATS